MDDSLKLEARQEMYQTSLSDCLLFILNKFNCSGSGRQVCECSYQTLYAHIRNPVGPRSKGKEGICPLACLSIFQSVGEGEWGMIRMGRGLMLSHSEKRLAKDLRRLRMVSAFTSSWLRLARGAGVSGMLKVLVRDWDLL